MMHSFVLKGLFCEMLIDASRVCRLKSVILSQMMMVAQNGVVIFIIVTIR